MHKNPLKKLVALVLSFVMMFSIIATVPAPAAAYGELLGQNVQGDLTYASLSRAELELTALEAQLNTEPGVHGFYGEYALGNPLETVEIIVEFVTPSIVAAEEMQRRGMRRARGNPRQDAEEDRKSVV